MSKIVPATRQWIEEAARIIRRGGLIAFPTETVYGLGANALDESAVRSIFKAKGRPAANPLIVHIASEEQLPNVALVSNPHVEKLAAAFWPGPLTLILPKRADIPAIVTAGGDTVAIRVPDHPVALALLRQAGVPIAAPSANRSEAISPTLAEHVAESLGDSVELILDGGACAVGLESTVLDLTVDPPTILRLGAVTADQIEHVLGHSPVIRTQTPHADARLLSPGQMRRHYAPKTPMKISENAVAEAALLPQAAVMTHEQTSVDNSSGKSSICIMPDKPQEYARRLYAALRELDAGGAEIILVQAVPDSDDWSAIRDRLTRASEPKAL